MKYALTFILDEIFCSKTT